MLIYIELTTENASINGLIHQGNPAKGHTLTDLALGPAATVAIRTQKLALADLVQMFIAYDQVALREFFDERGQLAVGQHLYAETFGRLPKQFQAQLREADAVDVRIIANDEHLLRLPWPLLADRGIFLCTASWSVALADEARPWSANCRRPPAS